MKLKRITALLLAGLLTLQSAVPLFADTLTSNESEEDDDDDSDESTSTTRSQVRQQARAEAAANSSEEETSSYGSSLSITNASEAADLSLSERVAIIGSMCQQDYAESGILASISAAQCILESGYLGSTLAQEANNCFGMKASLSGNSWAGSTWDGISTYSKQTGEEYSGVYVTITAAFRKYDSVADSIADHSAYLLNSTDGGSLRYAGLEGETDYQTAAQIIKNGGYATSSDYVENLCAIIERYDLTQYDTVLTTSSNAELLADIAFYRIRTSWEDAESQIGAYLDVEMAKEYCTEGYTVYDPDGNAVYTYGEEEEETSGAEDDTGSDAVEDTEDSSEETDKDDEADSSDDADETDDDGENLAESNDDDEDAEADS